MRPYPHHYVVAAAATPEGTVVLSHPALPPLETAPPEEFGGPGDRWSPETLLAGAVADCFILSFRAVARASGFSWTRLHATASATLERVEGGPRFTSVQVDATLAVPEGADETRALRLLEKAERGCLITRSLSCPSTLHARIETGS
jgi:organic hydroperoxide reductase OsmC/OhrA